MTLLDNMNPKVSILIISYNQQDLILDSVLSCLDQKYSSFEVVVSDDGSTDDTPNILRKLEAEYFPKLRVILNNKNQGITKNCNVGLRHCNGELIAFTGGDDMFYPNKLSAQVAAFDQDPALVFCYHPCHVMENNSIVRIIGDQSKDLVLNMYDMIANYGAQIPGPVSMVKKTAIPDYGFDESIPTASDWLFYIEVISKGRVIRLPQCLSIYRKHANNIGNSASSYTDDFFKTLEIVENKFPGDPNVFAAIKSSRQRLVLGLIYNSIQKQDFSNFKKYLEIYKKNGGKYSIFISFIWKFPFSNRLLDFSKSILKKYL